MGRALRRRTFAVVLLALISVAVGAGRPSPARADSDAPKLDCVYSQLSLSILSSFDAMVGRRVSCVMLYVDATTTWQQWESPWIDTDRTPVNDWARWISTPGTHRQAVITQDLIPSGVADSDWLAAGAAGDDEGYARTFARNLVAAGFGHAIIRLAPEANGNWFADSLGSTPAQWAEWDAFWRDTVIAMRSVPGADFRFDWCINYLYRDLPLSEIYPGNDVVDIIGVDVYDDGALGDTGVQRWNAALHGPDGVQAVLDFARAHGKPISIPEWGVDTTAAGGGGDDPAFVDGIARVVQDNPVVYQSYFFRYGHQTELAAGTRSLTAYRAAFGSDGYALGGRRAAARRPRLAGRSHRLARARRCGHAHPHRHLRHLRRHHRPHHRRGDRWRHR